jgi:DNA-binding transcriptional MerR regulator
MIDIKEEKLWLIDQIVRVENIALLSDIKRLLEQDSTQSSITKDDFWQDFSQAQQQQIERSIRQIEEGKWTAHNKVMDTFRKKYAQ